MTAGEFFQQNPQASQIDEGASLPFSFFSQPPDIRNWFSSYEYESPDTLHVSDVLEDVGKELLLNDKAEEDPIPDKEEKHVENVNPSFSEESSQNEYSLEFDYLTPEGRSDLVFDEESTVKCSSEVTTICTDDIRPIELSPTKKNENFPIINKEPHEILNNISNQNGILQCEEAFPPVNKQNSKQLGRICSSKVTTICTDVIRPIELSPTKKNENFPIINKETHEILNNISNQNGILQCEEAFPPMNKQDSKQLGRISNDKENGFISTRNSDGAKKHGENSKAQFLTANGKRSRLEFQKDDGVLGKERPFSVRRGLEEKTNVCFAEEAIKEEATGKWQCPRKRKPYVGPPLKQLRLERWVHRMV